MSDAAIKQYDFGTNWRSFLDGYLTNERIEKATESLQGFLGAKSLEGKTFLDIGNGSGLFSYCAQRLGADRVVSMDVNPRSVDCCRTLHERSNSPANWDVLEASVLDPGFMSSLGTFDVVYSWGVLHHTGDMWNAIRNAAKCVAPGGQFYIAIYNDADGVGIYSDGRIGSSGFWKIEKAIYVRLPLVLQRALEGLSAAALLLVYLVTLKNPVNQIRNHQNIRGMSWMVDIRDWLGGYPYEYARTDEIFDFVRSEFGFELEKLKSTNSLMNNEFVFRRTT